jgi:outer membrane protein TolC
MAGLCHLSRRGRISTGVMPRVIFTTLALAAWLAGAAHAQEPLTLADAIAAARSGSPVVRAARAGEAEAAIRVQEAAAAWWPRVDFSEQWQRGNMPVYVFGSLLSQRRFTEANFAIDALNHPDPVSNHRASLSFEQPLFSPEIVAGRRAALVGRDLAKAGRDAVERDAAVGVTTAYGQALVAQAASRAAKAAVQAGEDDLRRTRDRRASGLVTDADVLSIDVYLAQAKARAIDADSQARIAMAMLNRAMGRPLDREYLLAAAVPPGGAPETFDVLEAAALAARPEAHQAALGEQLARVHHDAARMAMLPQVGWQGGYEWNGASFGERAGGWMVGAGVRVNLFRGFGDRARLAATDQAVERARAEREAAESAIRLDVRATALRLESARARVAVGRAAVAQARESQRIIRDRYENGLAGVGDVLRAAQALLDAEMQQTAAEADVITGAAALDRAVGR